MFKTDNVSQEDIVNIVNTYGTILFKICFSMLGNKYDAEDAIQETMYKYIDKTPSFQSESHRKAWLIKVAKNHCYDILRYKKKHNHMDITELYEYGITEKSSEILFEVMQLPNKYKLVIHLFYIENYKTNEIADILGITSATVRKRLQYARKLLKINYEESDSNERK